MTAIPVTLILGAAVVYWTGGTSYAYPYLLFIPILIGASLFGVPGAVVVAALAGLALGPFMPLDVEQGIAQTPENWLTRLVFFTVIGVFAGTMFQRLRSVSRRDPATGLGNQIALLQRLDTALPRARVQHRPVTLALVRATDVDEILDAIGSDAGDEIMAGIAGQLRNRLPTRTVYRYSASSLALVFENTTPETAEEYAARIRDLGEESLTVRGIPVRIELCTGIAYSETGEETAHELIRRARIGVAAAHQRERDYAFYSSGDERQNTDTVRLVARLREALETDEFELHYQPRIRLAPNPGEPDRVEAVEGLIRWHPPGEALIPPGRFVGKVERTRLIVPLTRFVVDQASAFAAAHPGIRVSVNLAPRSLHDEELIANLIASVGDGAIDPARLEFEVTESALMTEPATSIRNLKRLRALGAHVSIDDFGTGYASFEYLRHLPVTGLKIDQTFLRQLTHDHRTRNLVRCMIEVGHGLDLEVTAEGVESPDAVEILRTLGCDAAQGFVYTPALPGGEIADWFGRATP